MKYAGFWRRLGAFLLDISIVMPLTTAITIWGENLSQNFHTYYLIPFLLFTLWYDVHLVKVYGGTPGKLILKIKVRKLDGSTVTYKEAFIRHSINIILYCLFSVACIVGINSINPDVYHSLNWIERSKEIQLHIPNWNTPLEYIMDAWIISEFIVLLTNKRRRSIHDYMAGTVVLFERKKPLIKWKKKDKAML